MRWGLYVPTAGAFGDPRAIVEIARAAEVGGWDGLFLWDVLPGDGRSVVDPMTTLAATAAVTTRLRLGTLVTPLARRRPWQLGLEVQTLSRLSDGRFILGVGLGGPGDPAWARFDEEMNLRARGTLFDESMEILGAMLSGRELNHIGAKFKARLAGSEPGPLVPIWMGTPQLSADSPELSSVSVARAARVSGLAPWWVGPTPAQVAPITAQVARARGSRDAFDVAITLEFGPERRMARGLTAAYAEAGATWLLEGISFYVRKTVADAVAVAQAGPPPEANP